MKFPRRSGILLHPTSLPGRFGIGDLGIEAYRFVDFLSTAGQHYWQILPLSPTGYADSPYQGLSAFAGNPMLISPEKLVENGHLLESDLANLPDLPEDRVDFGRVIPFKEQLLEKAYLRFKSLKSKSQIASFKRFCDEHSAWLDDFALFIALKNANNMHPWHEWESEIARRDAKALTHWRKVLDVSIESQKYRQWLFFEQWQALKQYANQHDVQFIGDIPIFVSKDSADVWANLHLFHFDNDLKPTVVSGVPPDYFSVTGQLWGNPIYRWDVMSENGYTWWIARFQQTFKLVNIARIDHFRGFYNYWEVPGTEMTAEHGHWQPGPRAGLFRAVTAALGEVAIIAEDLGDFDAESRAGVDALQAEFGYPGMKVLQFAFNGGPTDPFLPFNYTRDCVVYTGTHDNDTCFGWYQVTATDYGRDYARRYMAVNGSDIAWDMIRVAWSSVAHTAITTVQDLLNLGHDARMNTPGTTGAPNWCWRMHPYALNEGLTHRLRELTEIYARK